MGRMGRLTRQEPRSSAVLIDQVRPLARPLRGPEVLNPLLDLVGEARYVLLGEAFHGTEEFYTWRTQISRRLIAEKG
jgi:erythromycin esterase-like protein